VKRVIIPGFGH